MLSKLFWVAIFIVLPAVSGLRIMTDYSYGGYCESLTDGDCALVENCAYCSWSWPSNDPDTWASIDARCRCHDGSNSNSAPTHEYPSVTVKVDGQDTLLYVQYPDWSYADVNGTDIGFDYDNRMYLSTQPTLDTQAYFFPNLLGGYIEYDVDLSDSQCGCVTALYAVMMPDFENQEDPFQYCDASYVGGYGCPEFDLMQANAYGWRTTAHQCDFRQGSFSNCDGIGSCTTDVLLDQPVAYGPGMANVGIDTDYEFHVVQEFHEENGLFMGYTTTLTQDNQTVVLSSTNCGEYLSEMTMDIHNMRIAISNWGGADNMSWLEHDICSGSCSQTSTWSSIKNLEFNSGN